jgi:hypothetical protein
MVYDGTSRETSADHTTCLHNFLKKLGFEEKGQLREWMTSLEIDQHGDGKLNTS